MHEILRCLPPGSRVLDLGSGSGSFDSTAYSLLVVCVDSNRNGKTPKNFVQGDAARLPFRTETFRAIICNHSMEHFMDLEASLREIGRIVGKDGAIYVAVPDSTSATDRLYRWLASGGGHVNALSSPEQIITQVERFTGLPHRATRPLCTSLSFLNPVNRQQPGPRRLALLLGGREHVLMLLTWLLRRLDQLFGTRWCSYGWAFYFGSVVPQVDLKAWTNVCVRCGAGHPSERLSKEGLVRRCWLFFKGYECPNCGAVNLFTSDQSCYHLR